MWLSSPSITASLRSVCARLLAEEDGQDMVEYAFLTAFVGLSCVVAFSLIETAIHDGYEAWDQAEQDLWEPPDPPAPPPPPEP